MATTWTISTLERELSDGGVIVAHWRATPETSLFPSGQKCKVSVAVATRYLYDGDPLFAVSAVQMLGRVGGAKGRATLQEARAHETRVTVRAAMDQVLGRR